MTTSPALDPWQGSIDGLLIGPGTPYEIPDKGLEGLDELPGVRETDEPYPVSDGDFDGDDQVGARTITVTLEVMADAGVSYQDALAALRVVARPKRRVEWWFRLPGQNPRMATVKVRRFRIPTDLQYELGLATAVLQLKAPDPVLYEYGAPLSTGFPAPAGGLQFPLYTDGAGADLGYLDYGPPSPTGRLTLTNRGTADVYPPYTITGPIPPAGFEILRVGTADRLRFESTVAAGSSLVLDSATGDVVIDGSADRGGALTWRDWWAIPALSSVEIALVPLGITTAAQLSVPDLSGWW